MGSKGNTTMVDGDEAELVVAESREEEIGLGWVVADWRRSEAEFGKELGLWQSPRDACR